LGAFGADLPDIQIEMHGGMGAQGLGQPDSRVQRGFLRRTAAHQCGVLHVLTADTDGEVAVHPVVNARWAPDVGFCGAARDRYPFVPAESRKQLTSTC